MKLFKSCLMVVLGAAMLVAGSASASDRNWNLSLNPLGLVLGSANLRGEYGIAESFSLGPYVSYQSMSATVGTSTTTATGIGFGLAGTLFLGHPRFTDSWYLSPFVGYTTASSSAGGSSSSIAAGANIGYWWFWGSGFNLGLGLGIQYVNLNAAALGLGVSYSGLAPSAMFQIGYSF